jgi:hypothetical protein
MDLRFLQVTTSSITSPQNCMHCITAAAMLLLLHVTPEELSLNRASIACNAGPVEAPKM